MQAADESQGRPVKKKSSLFRRLLFLLRLIFRLVMIALILVICGFVAFAAHVSALTTPGNPKPADAIIVVTGGLNRLEASMNLLREARGDRLLISGANPSASRAALMTATGADPALFECCVDVDYAALDTIGNATESAKWVREHKFRSILLVTNNYHMPRSLLEMRRLLADVDIRPYPVVNSNLTDGGWLTDRDALRVVATEYVKYALVLTRDLTGFGNPGSLLSVIIN